MPILTNGDLAKELIRRQHTQPVPAPSAVNTTSSYEMVNPIGHPSLSNEGHITGGQGGKRFWRRRPLGGGGRRSTAVGDGVGEQDGGIEVQGHRVVSEPVTSSITMQARMLGRLRFRRGSEGTKISEDDRDETENTTETVRYVFQTDPLQVTILMT